MQGAVQSTGWWNTRWVPWSARVTLNALRHMSLISALKFRNYLLRRGQETAHVDEYVRLRLCQPVAGTVWLRNVEADLDTLKEIVFRQVYQCIPAALPACRYVIDLGANIGLA